MEPGGQSTFRAPTTVHFRVHPDWNGREILFYFILNLSYGSESTIYANGAQWFPAFGHLGPSSGESSPPVLAILKWFCGRRLSVPVIGLDHTSKPELYVDHFARARMI